MANWISNLYLQDTTAYLLLLVTVATTGSLQYGYHLAELNAPQDVITCRKDTIAGRLVFWSRSDHETSSVSSIPQCIPMNEAAFAAVSSIFTLGGLIGALCAGPVASHQGRLPTMRLTALLYIAGSLIETLSPAVPVMLIGRLVSGFGAGASTVVVPIYISEVAPPKKRGFFGVMTQVSINIGILLAQTLGFFLSHGNAWRWIMATGVFLGITLALGSTFISETPAWLAANGDVGTATKTLQRIRGTATDLQNEVDGWSRSDRGSGEQESLLPQPDDTSPAVIPPTTSTSPLHLSFIDVVKDTRYRKAVVAVVGIMVAQQFCGINSIIMYSVSLLADLLPISSALLTILVSIVNLVTTIACARLPDHLGRKVCLLVSIIGQGSSSLLLALAIVNGLKVLSAIAVLFFVGFFAVGLGPVPFILASELVDTEAVGATQSWALGANYVATFFVAQFFPVINTKLNDALGGHGWVYFLFAALAAVSGLFVLWKVPETKDKKGASEVWG